MAILKSFCCCSLFTGGILCGFYSIVSYLAILTVQIWWIYYQNGQLPIPEFILTGGYCIVFLASLFMLAGVAAKKTSFLLLWLVIMVIFFVPECVICLYLFINHMNVNRKDPRSLGVLVFYICRAVMNIFAMMIIHSLYSSWKEEKKQLQRLDNLALVFPPPNVMNRSSGHRKYEFHDNPAFNHLDKRYSYDYNKMKDPVRFENNTYSKETSNLGLTKSQEITEYQKNWKNPYHYKNELNISNKKWDSMGALNLNHQNNNPTNFYNKQIITENNYPRQTDSYEESNEFQCYVPRSLRNLNETDFYKLRPASVCNSKALYEYNYKVASPYYQSPIGLQIKSKSVDAITSLEYEDVTLEPIQRKPFDYLHRSGILDKDFEENNTLKDIAL